MPRPLPENETVDSYIGVEKESAKKTRTPRASPVKTIVSANNVSLEELYKFTRAQGIKPEMIDVHVAEAEGFFLNEDGGVNLVKYMLWLIKRIQIYGKI